MVIALDLDHGLCDVNDLIRMQERNILGFEFVGNFPVMKKHKKRISNASNVAANNCPIISLF